MYIACTGTLLHYVIQADTFNMILLPLSGTQFEHANKTIIHSLRNNVLLLLHEDPVLSTQDYQLTFSMSAKNVF